MLETGRQRLDELIADARSGKNGSVATSTTGENGDQEGRVPEGGAPGDGGSEGGDGVRGDIDVVRLWEEAKDQLVNLAGKGSQVRPPALLCPNEVAILHGERSCELWLQGVTCHIYKRSTRSSLWGHRPLLILR